MTLKWNFSSSRDTEKAKFKVCGIEAVVIDCDGDITYWRVHRNGKLIASGQEFTFHSDHFEDAMKKAEAALRKEVHRRKCEFSTSAESPATNRE